MKKAEPGSAPKVLLLGASVGNAWNIEALPDRMQNYTYEYDFMAKYEPDKTDILEKALNREESKPQVIIFKQCAAYFRADAEKYQPAHVQRYKQLAKEWVEKCRASFVVPLMATVVPITKEMPFKTKMKRLVKRHILQKDIGAYYREARLEGILDYNDWVRKYARQNGLDVLDLEAAVRVSAENRYLNPELTTDGLHLNEKAYQLLDPILVETVNKAMKSQAGLDS